MARYRKRMNTQQEAYTAAIRHAIKKNPALAREGQKHACVSQAFKALVNGEVSFRGYYLRIGHDPCQHTWTMQGYGRVARDLGSFEDTRAYRNSHIQSEVEAARDAKASGRAIEKDDIFKTQHDVAYGALYVAFNNMGEAARQSVTNEQTQTETQVTDYILTTDTVDLSVKPDIDNPEPEKIAVIDEPEPEPKEFEPGDWVTRVQDQIRPYVRERGFAEASMRMVINGAKLYLAMGRDPRAFKAIEHAVSLAWPEDARRDLGIEKFDPQTIKSIPKPVNGSAKIDAGTHEAARYVRHLEAARIPVALVGPAGCGKSHLPAQLAEEDDVAFGYVPMTAGASTTWLTGAFTLEGFITRPFVEIYEKGGIFLFDEMDAADPNMLLLVNNALAMDYFENPSNGKSIAKHKDFRPFAAMNTLGTGANRRYVGRERLDMATLDRWSSGMVELSYDHALERRIFDAILAA